MGVGGDGMGDSGRAGGVSGGGDSGAPSGGTAKIRRRAPVKGP